MVGRRIAFLLIVAAVLPAGGCGAIGWTRVRGPLSGRRPHGLRLLRLLRHPVPALPVHGAPGSSATLQALGDLGFQVAGPPKVTQEGEVTIDARTPDGRPAEIVITPQNNLSNLRVKIGPVCVGDSLLSRDLYKRVALNFGTLPRSYTPLEPTLSRRQDLVLGNADPYTSKRYETLLGEGLCPWRNPRDPRRRSMQPGAHERPHPDHAGEPTPYSSPAHTCSRSIPFPEHAQSAPDVSRWFPNPPPRLKSTLNSLDNLM